MGGVQSKSSRYQLRSISLSPSCIYHESELDYCRKHQLHQSGKTNLSHDGLNPTHVPYWRVDNPTLWDFLRLNDRKSRRKYVSIICHAHRSWSLISKGRFKANGLNFHVELVHVHAPLHVKSNVEFILQLFICLDTVGAPT